MSDPIITLGPLQVALLLILVAVVIALSVAFRLGLVRDLSIATIRSIIQLVAIGLVIGWVFDHHAWYWVVGLVVIMTLVAGVIGAGRSKVKLPNLAGVFTLVLAGVTTVTLLYIMEVVLAERMIGVKDWNPRYVVPLAGMLLGNAMTGGSLAVERLVADLKRERHDIEVMLSLGASPAVATQAILRAALGSAMTPTINTMLVVGIVQLPGMMTGQMLGGTAPLQAAMYQFLILVAIAFCTALSATILLLVVYRRFFTSAWQLDGEILRRLDTS